MTEHYPLERDIQEHKRMIELSDWYTGYLKRELAKLEAKAVAGAGKTAAVPA